MKRIFVLALLSAACSSLGQTTAFTYQGSLAAGGSPGNGKFDFVFSLFTTNTGGSQVGTTLTNSATGVSNGLFTVTLNFGAGIFTGPAYWLQIGVRSNGSSGAFTTLSPLQEITPTPAAIVANSALALAGALPSADLSGIYGGTVSFTNGADSFAGDGSGLTGLWKLKGNSGTSAQSNFVGTLDNTALEFHVNGARALRLEPTTGGPNLIGGSASNSVASGVYSATIAGGFSNVVEAGAFDATIAGGATNDIGPAAYGSFIGGGVNNVVSDSSYGAAIGGGTGNVAQINDTTVGGGSSNTASGPGATIGGGEFNVASGFAATIPGGTGNSAGGDFSFAAGANAYATNDGSFVWSDSLVYTFSSQAENEFAARATGGVRFVSAVEWQRQSDRGRAIAVRWRFVGVAERPQQQGEF
jgi:hypothetical protein